MDGEEKPKSRKVEKSKFRERKDSLCANEGWAVPTSCRIARVGRVLPAALLPQWRAKTALHLIFAGLVAVAGCATLPGSAKKVDDKKLSSAAQKAEEQKQENLSDIEDFLSRTQQYAQPDPQKSAAPQPQSIRDFLDSVDKTQAASTAPAQQAKPQLAAPPSDQAVANAQVAVGGAPSKPQQAIPALQKVEIKWSDPTIAESGSAQSEKPGAANSAIDTRSNEDSLWDRLLKGLSAQAEKKKDADSQWRLELAQLAADRDASATADSKSSGDASGDSSGLLPVFVDTAKAVRNLARNPNMTADDAVANVDKLRDMLTQRSDPNIKSIALCRKVTTFGAYDEMTREDFLAGRSTQTIVYCEIENLRADRGGDGQFQTKLATRIEVLTAEGKSMWQRQEPEILDSCHQKRKDFFIAQRITLPPTLPAGDYVLKVSIEDKLSNRTGEATHSFTVVSPLSVAKGG